MADSRRFAPLANTKESSGDTLAVVIPICIVWAQGEILGQGVQLSEYGMERPRVTQYSKL